MSLSFAFVVSMIRLAATSVRLAERHQWMNHQQRIDVENELRAVLKALKKKDKVHGEVDKVPDEFLDTELARDGDLRPDERL